jgi:hypothetical protein
MCIVVDANCLAPVFKKFSMNHAEFKPVIDWVVDGTGKIVFGGTKYENELRGYLGILAELSRVQKTVKISDEKVDDKAAWAAKQIKHKDFDDPHIVALLMVSGCRLICSLDERSHPYLKHKVFFNPASKRPKIYTDSKRAHLLMDKNIAEVCGPRSKLTVKQKENLSF